MTLRLRKTGLLALAAMVGGLAMPAWADDGPTTRSLVLSAQRVDGSPVEGVEIAIGDNVAVSNAVGIARMVVPADVPSDQLPLEVRDLRYQMAGPPAYRGPETGGAALFGSARLLPADLANMTDHERAVWVDILPGIFQSNWARGVPEGETMSARHPWHMAAFLDGFRSEKVLTLEDFKAARRAEIDAAVAATRVDPDLAPPPPPGDPTPAAPAAGPALRAIVTTPAGSPVEGHLVLLFELTDRPGEVRVAASSTTDRRGVVLFEELEPGRLYRPEAAVRDGLFAPSGIIQLEAHDTPNGRGARSVRLVLRERTRSLSGLIYNGEAPAPRVRVSTDDPIQPKVETYTDENGYFELGPLREGATTISISDPRANKPLRLNAIVGGNEMLIPLDRLTNLK